MKNNIFISYRHKGGVLAANHLAEKLKHDGYTVTFDKESLRAGHFDEQILKHINACQDFIVILDENVFGKTLRGEPREDDWLRRELAHAIVMKKNIIPITLDGFIKPNKEQLPQDISCVVDHQFIKYDIENFDKFYAKLCSNAYLKSNNLLRKYWKYVLGIITLLFAISLSFHTGEYMQSKREKLVFVGGGSVSNLIDSLSGQNDNLSFIRNYPNSMYINLSSGKAWSVLEEEISKERNIRELNGYLPICLYADSISERMVTSVQNRCSDFKSVIGIKLGVDPLTVYIKNDPIFKKKLGLTDKDINCIDIKLLGSIIDGIKDDTLIWATSATSGTLKLYNDSLKKYNFDFNLVSMVEEGVIKRFYDNTIATTINDKNQPYVFLGSQFYYPKSLSKQDYLAFRIKDSGKYIVKPMYMYFVTFADKTDPNCAIIPKQIIKFLKAIHAEDFIKKEVWDKLRNGTYECNHSLTIIEKE